MVLQSLLTIILLYALSHPKLNLITIAKIKHLNDYKRLLPSTLFFISNVTIGLSALALVNIPMFSAFRRLTVLFVMLAEFLYLRKSYTKPIVLSVFVLTLGAFISALGDVTFTLKGYLLVFINNVLTACYLTSIKRIMKELSLDPISLLYYQSLLSFPLIVSISIANGELVDAHSYYFDNVNNNNLKYSPLFLPALTFVAVSAFFVNLSTSVCTHVTSPLTTAVAGQIKNVLQSLLGFFSWGYVPTPLNIFGLLVALAGQLAFAYFKYRNALTDPSIIDTGAGSAAISGGGAQQQQQQQQQDVVPNQGAKDLPPSKDSGTDLVGLNKDEDLQQKSNSVVTAIGQERMKLIINDK